MKYFLYSFNKICLNNQNSQYKEKDKYINNLSNIDQKLKNHEIQQEHSKNNEKNLADQLSKMEKDNKCISRSLEKINTKYEVLVNEMKINQTKFQKSTEEIVNLNNEVITKL